MFAAVHEFGYGPQRRFAALPLSGVGGRPDSSHIAKTALMTSEQSSGKIHAILQLG